MFRLDPKKPVITELRRVVRDRLDSAIDLLAESGQLTPAGVHQLRKRFKRLKALFRLVRIISPQAGGQEITRYRDLGRELSLSRDRDVMEQTLVKLQFLTDDTAVIQRLETLLQRLQKSQANNTSQHLTTSSDELRSRLLEARAAAESMLRGEESTKALIEGYLMTYRKARKIWKMLPESRQQEDWHNWRKRVKDDWYQTQLLADFREDKTKKRLARLRQLADLLGYDHDLQNLSEMIETLTVRTSPVDHEVQSLIDRQRNQLQAACLDLGEKLYRRKASRVCRQFSHVKTA